MATHNVLTNAKNAKKDEFYTQLVDIERELKHYKSAFQGKTVFCNCDDPYESNFFKYFAMNFNHFGLKKLIATSYSGSPIVETELQVTGQLKMNFGDEPNNQENKKPYKIVITEVKDENGDGAVDLTDVKYLIKNNKNTLTMLEGDGDFRSAECIELLKEADIVVTNPPFSLFREFVSQLIKYEKKFIIIGNKNAITYKEIFPLIKENKIWLGMKPMGGSLWFATPEGFSKKSDKIVDGVKLTEVPCCWFTNIDHPHRHEKFILYKKYTPEEYVKYDNYDAINVDKTADIPCDYDGYIGVPITFLDKYNPEQFEIIKFRKGNDDKDLSVNGKCPYFRVVIKRRTKNEN